MESSQAVDMSFWLFLDIEHTSQSNPLKGGRLFIYELLSHMLVWWEGKILLGETKPTCKEIRPACSETLRNRDVGVKSHGLFQ